MKILFNNQIFCANTKKYKLDNHNVEEHYNDNNILIRRVEKDEFDRFVDTKWYDDFGNLKEHMHKYYYKNFAQEGFVETFKSKTQKYLRHGYKRVEDGFVHNVDEYKSITCPSKSYTNDFIKDLSGNLVKIISNGKITVLR